jgi:signal transduction histidine kinase
MSRAAVRERLRCGLLALWKFTVFFLLLCFVTTCCMLLFLETLQRVTGISLAREQLQPAARLTFLNVVLLSLLCALLDSLRRKILVGRPVRRIVRAARQVMAGDFTARIPRLRGLDAGEGLGEVIDCFNQMAEELSKMETLRTDFIANVSHEWKTPLSVIQSYGTILQQPDLPAEKRQECAKAVADAARRLAAMVTNVLKLNKLENQTVFPDARIYDLGEQLCACLLGFESVWERKNLDIQPEIAEGVRVKADPEILALVWNNLFSNAIKFTEAGGRVSVSLEREGDWAVVRVEDTGCGISPEVGRHIFEKFYQGDPSHAAQGNGLGLALVKRVMDILGGEILVQSEVGKGSTFTVRLRREPDGAR